MFISALPVIAKLIASFSPGTRCLGIDESQDCQAIQYQVERGKANFSRLPPNGESYLSVYYHMELFLVLQSRNALSLFII